MFTKNEKEIIRKAQTMLVKISLWPRIIVQLTDDNHCDNAQIVATSVLQKLFQSFFRAGWLCGWKTHLTELFPVRETPNWNQQ